MLSLFLDAYCWRLNRGRLNWKICAWLARFHHKMAELLAHSALSVVSHALLPGRHLHHIGYHYRRRTRAMLMRLWYGRIVASARIDELCLMNLWNGRVAVLDLVRGQICRYWLCCRLLLFFVHYFNTTWINVSLTANGGLSEHAVHAALF